VYGDGRQRRDWLYVTDHCAAIWAVCTRGDLAQGVYNIGGEAERANIDVVRAILRRLDKTDSLIRHVTDRLGHDRRYAMDIRTIQAQLGWRPTHSFDQGLEDTVDWYVANERWWRPLLGRAAI
jgi:dTDP-glucose 4,6-dehydratase